MSRVEAMRKEREAEDRKRKVEAQVRAKKIWDSALPCVEHPYLAKKGIQPFKVRVALAGYHYGELVVPMWGADGKMHSLQFIDANGGKQFLPGGRKKGCYFTMGKPVDVLYVVEGVATGASVHEATGKAVAVAFDGGNLLPVSQALKAKYPCIEIVICADDDYRTKGNPGLTNAVEAARAVQGRIAIPAFGDNRPEKATDFNDLHQALGMEAVRNCIGDGVMPEPYPVPVSQGTTPHDPGIETDPLVWPEPQVLASKVPSTPYPLGALPPIVRNAVEEVLGFVKAPVPLVASSALGALSLVIQSHYDMERTEKLVGPVGLFLLSIADSGERKSSCDGYFTKAIRDYEAQQMEGARPLLKDYRADLEAWEAKAGGIKDKIRVDAKVGKDTNEIEMKLRELEHGKPEPPKVPRLIYGDATPESLKWALAKVWPSAGIVSSEAGSVFGAHGMNKESIMRNLATFDQLWDGTDIATDRRNSESFLVHGARLTIALQVQEATLRTFLHQSGDLARGIGFLARCLLAWPESTQGYRFFTEAPALFPHLAMFNRRIASILERDISIGADGALAPYKLAFTPEAFVEWRAFHDRVERELCEGGKLRDVRDVASKIADNAARIAALFHVFEGFPGSLVGVGSFNAAAQVAEWHLNESHRFFGELALPEGLANAARLETWIIGHCLRNRVNQVPTKEVQRLGPGGLRDRAKIEAAVVELEELGRAQLVKDGKRKFIAVNPLLLGEPAPAIPAPAIPASAIPATVAILGLDEQGEDSNNRNNRNNRGRNLPVLPTDDFCAWAQVDPVVSSNNSVPQPTQPIGEEEWI